MARRKGVQPSSGAGGGAHKSDSTAVVLLVEPDQATRHLYAREIGRLWEVIEASGAQEARASLCARVPDAVVLEPYTAGLGGDAALAPAWEFLQELAAAHPGVPVLVCSVVDERRTAYALGASLYLLKPMTPQQLVNELQHLLAAPAIEEQTQ